MPNGQPHGLYIHIPFCASKCPYCNFYSVSDFDDSTVKAYLAACLNEIKSLPAALFDTIYIGGGTPTKVAPQELYSFIESVLGVINFSGGEFTIEANPESLTSDYVDILYKTGVNRLSIGVQSLDDGVLRLLGRAHSAKLAIGALDMALSSGRYNVSADLIYDIPSVNFTSIESSLEQLIAFKPHHISAYSYTPDTGFLYDANTDAERSDNRDQMEAVIKTLANAGYVQYEVSNYSLGRGNVAKHNSKYWQMLPYYGIGAGAHSMYIGDGNRIRYGNEPSIERYIAQFGTIDKSRQRDDVEIYTAEDALKESIVFGLRMLDGVNMAQLGDIPDDMRSKLKILEQNGLITQTVNQMGNNIKVTTEGLYLLDSVMTYLW